MKTLEMLKIKLFSDGAKIDDFIAMAKNPMIKGYTTNPTLMRKAGVSDYLSFVNQVMPIIEKKPISFEVISDDFNEMKLQAKKLASFGDNIFIKIPIMNTKKESSIGLISDLIKDNIKLNITAVFTLEQVRSLVPVLASGLPTIVSVFAGRIADTGVDPMFLMKESKKILSKFVGTELLWASPRELLNIFQAEEAGCDIITIQPEITNKLKFVEYDLNEFTLDTVKMFYNDAVSSGLTL